MWQIDPFTGVDPYYLEQYEDEVYPTYEAQGIDLDAIVEQNINNPLSFEGVKNWVMVRARDASGKPIYTYFLQIINLSTLSVPNYEPYFLVKKIERNQQSFFAAIDRCGEFCVGKR